MDLQIEGEAHAALLCRLVGLAAQLDLPAPAMRVAVTGATMLVELELRGIAPALERVLAEKMARCIGVSAVMVDGQPLGAPAFA